MLYLSRDAFLFLILNTPKAEETMLKMTHAINGIGDLKLQL